MVQKKPSENITSPKTFFFRCFDFRFQHFTPFFEQTTTPLSAPKTAAHRRDDAAGDAAPGGVVDHHGAAQDVRGAEAGADGHGFLGVGAVGRGVVPGRWWEQKLAWKMQTTNNSNKEQQQQQQQQQQ